MRTNRLKFICYNKGIKFYLLESEDGRDLVYEYIDRRQGDSTLHKDVMKTIAYCFKEGFFDDVEREIGLEIVGYRVININTL